MGSIALAQDASVRLVKTGSRPTGQDNFGRVIVTATDIPSDAQVGQLLDGTALYLEFTSNNATLTGACASLSACAAAQDLIFGHALLTQVANKASVDTAGKTCKGQTAAGLKAVVKCP